MTPATIKALNRLNQDFYLNQAATFAATRQYPWPSWERFATGYADSHPEPPSPWQVLDVGCGQGRFATYLEKRCLSTSLSTTLLAYTGCDLSTQLLDLAKQQHPTTPSNRFIWQSVDLVPQLQATNQPPHPPLFNFHEKFHVIALFGVLHHIPAQDLREKLVINLAKYLAPGGEIWLSIWAPARLGVPAPPALSRIEVGKKYSIDQSDLEDDDFFVGWQNSASVRYVHWLSATEEKQLIAAAQLTVVDHWESQLVGERGNIYYRLANI